MSDNMNDKNENLDETVVDETAETASNETVDDVATDDIAADASSADSIESIDFAVVYDDDNADIEIAASDGAEISDDVNDGDTAVAADGDAVVSADNADTTEVADDAATAADTADGSDVVANNANQMRETLALRSSDEPTVLESHEMVKADSATSVSSQLDREIKHHRKKDAFFFKANPTFALDHVTVTNRKTGRNILDDLSLSFHAGATHAVLVDAEDREQHQALLATMVGMVRTDRGNVMHKSTNLSDVEPVEMLGHRIGFIPQRFAFRPDLDAESNVLYAMDASNRNFLKPKPVIARELLKRVGFDEVTSGLAVGEVSELNQRRVAIARALSCEAEVIIADEPTAGLDADDAAVVLDLLKKFKRDADRKRAIIVVTTNPEIADAMEHSVELD
ncbi:ATP-binding cassette domain-containing protein [Bifidobacterium pseudocatenulatum]|uniref:ATP-binding cassette domain-containing protein n=1 Tax=Bifidobacterium pseudocatenulatum TaxID=28026 RepID=UPI001CFDE3E3|nr:ATP-binding cassette domain-containing protein [Bifidobacterium pseudocatenulatum]MCB4875263.1 ATP-binding cassette domain-containing protein [Bifidobacterium pseudocatenulatum]